MCVYMYMYMLMLMFMFIILRMLCCISTFNMYLIVSYSMHSSRKDSVTIFLVIVRHCVSLSFIFSIQIFPSYLKRGWDEDGFCSAHPILPHPTLNVYIHLLFNICLTYLYI